MKKLLTGLVTPIVLQSTDEQLTEWVTMACYELGDVEIQILEAENLLAGSQELIGDGSDVGSIEIGTE